MEARLTEREIVAMHVLQGLVSRTKDPSSPFGNYNPPQQLVSAALEYADEFFKQSRRPDVQPPVDA